MTSTKIYGAQLYLTIEGENIAADLTSYELTFEDADTDGLTFGEVMNVGDSAKLKLGAIQSTATDSFWRTVWDAANTKGIPFVLAPHGNSAAAAEQPHIKGTVDIGPRPNIGGAADPKKPYTFEIEWTAHVDRDLVVTG